MYVVGQSSLFLDSLPASCSPNPLPCLPLVWPGPLYPSWSVSGCSLGPLTNSTPCAMMRAKELTNRERDSANHCDRVKRRAEMCLSAQNLSGTTVAYAGERAKVGRRQVSKWLPPGHRGARRWWSDVSSHDGSGCQVCRLTAARIGGRGVTVTEPGPCGRHEPVTRSNASWRGPSVKLFLK